ncbi:Exonuclease 3'-5' domain-containing protein 2 [Stylophora pistillata]|uniref:Exonuclease 3'-5' domain-containing protein 2 n=2 Tax=Stylophora pistillata TaxID=50429 RepID=A0A2B4RIJ1_STYPI|nr:Exonuclease 3'-5' domain-containing protein 2 [Stylophora pistillata]
MLQGRGKALKSFLDYAKMKKKALRAYLTHKDEPYIDPGVEDLSGTTRKFILPSDYFSRNEENGKIPQSCKFRGTLHLVRNESDERRLVENGVVCQDFRSQDALGLDTEFVVRRNALPTITLIQLASNKNAVLWICSRGSFREKLPPYLLSLFLGNVLKVGNDISQDASLIQNQYGECINNMVDTLIWAREMNCNPLNLRALCAIFLNERLTKNLGKSNWSQEELTERQLLYAATDAWVSLRVYKEMKRTALVNRLPLSPPLESTMDVFKTLQLIKSERRKRKKESERSKKKAGFE